MLTYAETQSRAMDRFGNRAKLAKLKQRDANLTPDDDLLVRGAKREAAARAREDLVEASSEMVILDVSERLGAELAPDVKRYLDTIKTHLDKHIGSGQAMAWNRRVTLERAIPFATAPRNDTFADGEFTAALNQPLPRRPLRQIDPRERVVSGTLRRPFKDKGTQKLIAALKGVIGVLDKHSQQLTSVFSEEHKHRDDISAARWQPELGEEIDRIERDMGNRPVRLAALLPQNALRENSQLGINRGLRRPSVRAAGAPALPGSDALWASSPEIPSSRPSPAASSRSSPPPVAGVRRPRSVHDSDQDQDAMPAPRRQRLGRLDNPEAPQFAIHEDQPDDRVGALQHLGSPGSNPPPVTGVRRPRSVDGSDQDQDAMPAPRRQRLGRLDNPEAPQFAIHEDQPGDRVEALQPLPTPSSEWIEQDGNEENVNSGHANLWSNDRSRDGGFGL